MLRPRLDHPKASLTARLATPLAAVLALAALARFQADPAAAAETGYLAVALGLVLVAAASVAPRPSAEAVAGALLATAAVWALPPGPARGAVGVAVAAGALAVAVVRWLPLGDGRPARGRAAPAPLPAVPVLALAFGLQALLRGAELLTAPSALLAVVLFVGFPLAGAVAVLALARLHGRRRALLAAVAVLLVGPGFRPATVAALFALAAASWLLARDPLGSGLLPGAGGEAVRGLGERERATVRLAVRVAAGAVLLAPFAWDPAIAAVCLAAGVAAAAPGLASGGTARRWLGPALGLALLAAALALPGRALDEAAPFASLVVLAVPALALPGRNRAPTALAALLLALAAARGVSVEGALAPAAGLAALAVPRRGAVLAVQGGWSAVLLGAASLLAAYPWLREAPLPDALTLVGIEPGWPGALAAVLATAVLAALAAVAAGSATGARAGPGRGERAAARAAGLAAFVLALAHLPAAGATPVTGSGTILSSSRPTRSFPVEDASVGSIVVDTSLANAAALPEGRPVATLRLREPGRPDRTWTLRVGEETGEWAAGRSDLREEGVAAPATWSSWVAGPGDFFGRRYRAVHHLDGPSAPHRLELGLRSDLPPDVELTVFHLELRP